MDRVLKRQNPPTRDDDQWPHIHTQTNIGLDTILKTTPTLTPQCVLVHGKLLRKQTIQHTHKQNWYRLKIYHSSDPTASGCTGTYSASSTLPSVLAAKCDEATCTTLQTSVTDLGKVFFLIFFFARASSIFGAFLLSSVRMNLKSCKFETWPHARTFAKCGKLGFVISPSISLSPLLQIYLLQLYYCAQHK